MSKRILLLLYRISLVSAIHSFFQFSPLRDSTLMNALGNSFFPWCLVHAVVFCNKVLNYYKSHASSCLNGKSNIFETTSFQSRGPGWEEVIIAFSDDQEKSLVRRRLVLVQNRRVIVIRHGKRAKKKFLLKAREMMQCGCWTVLQKSRKNERLHSREQKVLAIAGDFSSLTRNEIYEVWRNP